MPKPKENYYAILGVSSTATPDEIRRAYRSKIVSVHLDKLPEDGDTDECYKTIEAYRILSNRKLRAKYDIERNSDDSAGETFVPAGAICFDVGLSQMSKRLLQNISDWKKEFEEKLSVGVSDNYFETFSTLIEGVVEEGDESGHNSYYQCHICDRSFPNESHHSEEILQPYKSMFLNRDNISGLCDIFNYMESALSYELFNWKPRKLPSRLLGVFGSEIWSTLSIRDAIVEHIWREVPSDSIEDVEDQINYIQETFLSDSETREDMFPQTACKIICWVLENQDDQDAVVNRINNYLEGDDVTEIIYMGSAMKNILGCVAEEWNALVALALDSEQFELAMLWTKLGSSFGEELKWSWFELGMKIRHMDAVMAHFCFLLGGYDSDEDWEFLADIFTRSRNHFASLEYHMHTRKFMSLLATSRSLSQFEPEGAKIYRNVYYSFRVKSILEILTLRQLGDWKTDDYEELEELIEIVDETNDNPIKGFRLIANAWPKVFKDPAGYGIHLGTIRYLRKKNKRLDLKSFNLILAAVHFLDKEEMEEQIATLDADCFDLSVREMERSLACSDFESLTEILEKFSRRSVPAARKVLDESDRDSTAQGSHTQAMTLLISGTVRKVFKDWLGATTDYQTALLCSPECNNRILPCISKLTQDIEFHEGVLGQVQSEIKELKNLFDSKEYPDVETFSALHSSSLVLTDVTPREGCGYKDSINKISKDKDQMNNEPPPEDEPLEKPTETNTPMITLDKNQEAIESVGNVGSSLDKALAYVDLLKALPLAFQPGPIVMAASHFLRAMDEDNEPASLFAYKNSISQLAENLLQIDEKTQATIQHCLTHKTILSISFAAHEKLSKGLQRHNQPKSEDIDSGQEEEKVTSEEAEIYSEESEDDSGEVGKNSNYNNNELKKEVENKGDIEENENSSEENYSNSDKDEIHSGEEEDKLNKEENSSDEEEEKSEKEENSSDEEEDNSVEQNVPEKVVLKVKKGKNTMQEDECTSEEDEDSEKEDNSDTESNKLEEDGDSSEVEEIISLDDEMNTEPSENKTQEIHDKEPKMKVKLIQKSEMNLINKLLKNVVTFPKIEPLGNVPTPNCADLVYIETIGNSYLNLFCNQQITQKYQSPKIPQHLHAYTHFVEVWKGRSSLTNFAQARLRAMEKLLEFKGWTLKNVENNLCSPLQTLNEEGYAHDYMSELSFPEHSKAYQTIHGFKIDTETGQVWFLLSKDKGGFQSPGNLFDTSDILEIFSNSIEESSLILQNPDPTLKSHPFKEFKYEPANLLNCSNYFQSLSSVAMLLYHLSSGIEISANVPFFMKTTDEGLLQRFEKRLRWLLRPLKSRKMLRCKELANRIWLNMSEVIEDVEVDETSYIYKIGEVKPEAKLQTPIITLNGYKSPEVEFSKDFTENYDEIGNSFPELLRIKELVKISIVYKKLLEFITENNSLVEEANENLEGVCDMSTILEHQKISRKTNSDSKGEKCIWVPSTFGDNLDPETYDIGVGVRMNPELVSGNVKIPKDCVFFRAIEILAPKVNVKDKIQKYPFAK